MKTKIGLLIGGLSLLLGSAAGASTLPSPQDVCGGVGSASGAVNFSQATNGAQRWHVRHEILRVDYPKLPLAEADCAMESTRQIWYKIAFCITFFLGERNMIRKVLFGVFAAGVLSADTINSSTATFDLTTGGGDSPSGVADGTVSQFNTTLGTLTGITAFISADININAMVNLLNGGPGSTFSAEFSEIPTLANLPGVSLIDTSIEYNVNPNCVTDQFGNHVVHTDDGRGRLTCRKQFGGGTFPPSVSASEACLTVVA
jgi:hypothetical protein